MGSVAYQNGMMNCGAFVRTSRRALKTLSNLDREPSRLFSAKLYSQYDVVCSVLKFCLPRTLGLKLLEQLVVLSTELGPFRKLILAAGCVQLGSYFKVLSL